MPQTLSPADRSVRCLADSDRGGFTLIELMITLAILGILTAIALPAYRSYILRTHRTDAFAALAQDQTTLERCYAANFSYLNCAPGGTALTFPHASSQSFYTISNAANPGSSTTYLLTAVPANGSPQQADTTCASMTIDQTNTKGATDASGVAQPSCWNP